MGVTMRRVAMTAQPEVFAAARKQPEGGAGAGVPVLLEIEHPDDLVADLAQAVEAI